MSETVTMSASVAAVYRCGQCDTGCVRCPTAEAEERTWEEAARLVEAIAADPIAAPPISVATFASLVAYHLRKRAREVRQ